VSTVTNGNKNELYFSILIFSLVIFSFSADASTWIHIAFNQSVESIQIHPKDPSIFYARVRDNDMFSSTDGCNSWKQMQVEQPWSSICSIAPHPTDTNILYATVYSSIGGPLPLKSLDGGESWEEIWQGLGLDDLWRAYFPAIAVDPNDPETVYLGDPRPTGASFVSRDGGKSWKFSGGAASSFVTSSIDSMVYKIKRNMDGSIAKSSDKGESWKVILGGTDQLASAIAVGPAGEIYVHGSRIIRTEDPPRHHFGMYRSEDKGETWESIDNGFPTIYVFDWGGGSSLNTVYSIAVDMNHPEVIYAGTMTGVYQSINSGRKWHPLNDGLTDLNVYCLAVNPSDSSVYAGTGNGLYRLEYETYVDQQGKITTTWGKIKKKV
jgi:hypothetical protein